MTNDERYKTPEERAEAFSKFCISRKCDDCACAKQGEKGISLCEFKWLALEAEEEKPLACPFCGMYAVCDRIPGISPRVRCTGCGASIYRDTFVDVITAWNRRTR